MRINGKYPKLRFRKQKKGNKRKRTEEDDLEELDNDPDVEKPDPVKFCISATRLVLTDVEFIFPKTAGLGEKLYSEPVWVNSYDALLRSWLSVRNKELMSPGMQFTLITGVLALSVIRQNAAKQIEEEEKTENNKQETPKNKPQYNQQKDDKQENPQFPYY